MKHSKALTQRRRKELALRIVLDNSLNECTLCIYIICLNNRQVTVLELINMPVHNMPTIIIVPRKSAENVKCYTSIGMKIVTPLE